MRLKFSHQTTVCFQNRDTIHWAEWENSRNKYATSLVNKYVYKIIKRQSLCQSLQQGSDDIFILVINPKSMQEPKGQGLAS